VSPAFVEAVCRALAAAADPERAPGQQRYMKSRMPYRGLTSAQLTKVMRPLLADEALAPRTGPEWEASVRALWDGAAYREERYAAQALLRHRRYAAHLTPAAVPLLAHLITTSAWWDHVDDLASHPLGEVLRHHRREVTPVLRAWAVATTPIASADPPSTLSPAATDDGALWLRRSAIIAQLNHHEETDLDLLTDAIDANLETNAQGEPTAYGREFFIRKAIGWALRQHARTDPDWVRAFVAARGDRLAGLSRREALKHL